MLYEGIALDGRKDAFSPARAQRIDWIQSTLEQPNADLFKGWDVAFREYMPGAGHGSRMNKGFA